MRGKVLLLLMIWVVQAVPFVLLLPLAFADSVREYLDSFLDADFWKVIGVASLVITAAQAAFLWPVRRPASSEHGRSLWWSIAVAAAGCAALTFGAIGVLFDAARLAGWTDWWLGDRTPAVWGVIAAGAASWLVWTPLIRSFCESGRRETALARLAARIFLGTLVEVVAMTPLAVMVRRKTNCYCSAGSFGALLACIGVGWFAFGPAAFLPLLARRRKRWYAGHCDACGYDMSGCMGAERCPECGAGWKAAPR